MKKTMLLLIFSLCFISASSFSQDRTGKIGMLIMGDPFKPNVDLGMTFWLNNTETLEPVLGFSAIDPDEGTTQTNVRLGLGWKHYFNQNKITPYIGGRAGYNSISGGGDSYSDLIMGAIFGVEYFLSEWFSAGCEFQMNYADADKNFSPSGLAAGAKNWNTAQTVIIRFYFK